MERKIRRARLEDASAIQTIDGEMGGILGLEISQRPIEYYQDWLRFHRNCKRYPAFVGTSQGKVIWWLALGECPGGYPFDGVATLELGLPERLRDDAELTDLLLRFLEQQAIRLGHYKLMACLDAEQRYLLHTYRRVGFRDVGTLRSHGYRRGKLVDLVVMERLLPTDMKAMEEYYSDRYSFYREYFEGERRRAGDGPSGEEDYTLEYEEVETPEEQLPEGIVRFLRTKKAPDGAAPARHPAAAGQEEGTGEEAPPEPVSAEPRLPEGIVRFLKSKKRPDGTLANLELPPVVPVKLSPVQGGRPEAPEEPAPGLEVAPPGQGDELEGQLQFGGVKK